MAGFNPELAKKLYDNGDISDGLYRQIVSDVSRETPDPQTLYDEAKASVNKKFGVNATEAMIVHEAENLKKSRDSETNRALEKTGKAASKRAALEIKKKELGLSYNPEFIPQEPSQETPALASDVVAPVSPTAHADPGAGIYGGLEKAYNDQKQAAKEGADIGVKAAAAETAFLDKTYQDAEAARLETDRQETDRQLHLDSQLNKLNEKMEKYAASPANVGQLFASMNTGQKIIAGIALFLGSAPNGSAQNSALQTMQASLDADLAKQKAGIEGQKGIYNEMLEQYRDARAAEAAARVAYINNAQIKVNSLASQYKGATLQANAKALIGKLEEEKLKSKVAFMKIISELPAPVQNIGPNTPVSQIRDKDTRERFVPGFGLATSPSAASKVMEQGAGIYQAISNIDELIKISKKPFKSLNLNERARADTIKNILIGQLRTPVVGPGALNEGERKLLERTIANPTDIFSINGVNITRLNELRGALNRSRDAMARAYGVEVANPVPSFKPFE